jgi:hypothetical protein
MERLKPTKGTNWLSVFFQPLVTSHSQTQICAHPRRKKKKFMIAADCMTV